MRETGTARLHRALRAHADRVCRTFLDPDALAKFLRKRPFKAACTSVL